MQFGLDSMVMHAIKIMDFKKWRGYNICKTLIEHFSVFRGYLITLTPNEWDKSYTHN